MKERATGEPPGATTPLDMALMIIEGLLALGQVVLCFLFYNHAGWTVVLVLGWALLAASLFLGWRAIVDLLNKGQAPEGESWHQTGVVVDTGVYGLVRHPMYLSFMLVPLALICLAQHWLSAILGVCLVAILIYEMVREERDNLDKFGPAYEDYMQRVPRMNLLSGLLRALLAIAIVLLPLSLSSCTGAQAVQDWVDERALRKQLAIPAGFDLVSYDGYPSMAGFGQREGLEISARYRLDGEQAAAFATRARANGWQPLPIPDATRSKIRFQGLKVPLDAQQGLYLCRTAGDDVLHARETRSCDAANSLHDIILGVLDTSTGELSAVIRAGY